MKDAFNNELYIGDKVIFIHNKSKDANLAIGRITNMYQNRFKDDELSIDGRITHIYPNRVVRIDKLKEMEND